jgi:hypothetical protein
MRAQPAGIMPAYLSPNQALQVDPADMLLLLHDANADPQAAPSKAADSTMSSCCSTTAAVGSASSLSRGASTGTAQMKGSQPSSTSSDLRYYPSQLCYYQSWQYNARRRNFHRFWGHYCPRASERQIPSEGEVRIATEHLRAAEKEPNTPLRHWPWGLKHFGRQYCHWPDKDSKMGWDITDIWTYTGAGTHGIGCCLADSAYGSREVMDTTNGERAPHRTLLGWHNTTRTF